RRAAVGADDAVVDLAAIPWTRSGVEVRGGAPVEDPAAGHESSSSCVAAVRPCPRGGRLRDRRSRTAPLVNAGVRGHRAVDLHIVSRASRLRGPGSQILRSAERNLPARRIFVASDEPPTRLRLMRTKRTRT